MVQRKDLKRLEEVLWEIPQSYRSDMRVPARIYSDEELLDAALQDRSVEQLVNTATLPGVVEFVVAMPDIHQGYGPPIGGVAAMDVDGGVISPGAVGYDINCGVRLVATSLDVAQVRPLISEIADALYSRLPTGVGKGGDLVLKGRDMDEVLERGAEWVVSRGFGTQHDLARTEAGGRLREARASAVSKKAKDRGGNQVGTLGAGNHFVELGEIVEIYDEKAANVFGLRPGQLVLWVHSGSRGLGHQVCTDFVDSLQSAVQRYGIKLPDRELVCTPFHSPEGQNYMAAMSAAANFAWANRQMLMDRARNVLMQLLLPKFPSLSFRQVYDVAHNIAKIEEFAIDGKLKRLVVHRKGATRSFGAGNPELPDDYRPIGQPVLVPGDMGTGSYILLGTAESATRSFSSCCHGAGRVASRHAISRQVRGEDLQRRLAAKGIIVRGPWKGLAEEAPEAYKDIDHVVDVVHRAGLARKVAKAVPIAVVKG